VFPVSPTDDAKPLALEITLFTFKEGLLARAAHDLQLHVEHVEARLFSGNRLAIEVDPLSIQVDGAVVHGEVHADILSADNRREIQHTLQESVLKVARYPMLRFEGTFEESSSLVEIQGTLELCGVQQTLSTRARAKGGTLFAELEIRPSAFGIQPFRALMGAIRVQDRVVVRIRGVRPSLNSASI